MGKLKQRLKNGLTNLLIAPLFVASSGCVEELQYPRLSIHTIDRYCEPSERFTSYRYYDPLTKINVYGYYDSLHQTFKGTFFEPSRQMGVLKIYVDPRHRFNNPCFRNYDPLKDLRIRYYYHNNYLHKHRRH